MVRREHRQSEENTSGGVTDDALAANGWDDNNDVDDGIDVGEHGPGPWPRLVEQKGVHGIGTAGEHAKRHVHGNED